MSMSAITKYMIVISEFTKRSNKTLTSKDPILKEKLSLSDRQISRILEELSIAFDSIVRIQNSRPIKYKLIKPIDLLEEAFENSDELGWLYELVKEKDPEVFAKLGNYSKHTDHIYQFQNTPFEDLESIETKESFIHLKNAVKNREYRDIVFKDSKEVKDVKCLKLLFLEGNWYIAYVETNQMLKLGRISFIKEVSYSKKSESFQPSTVKRQMEFLKNRLQNPFTLFDKEPEIATIKAMPNIAKYFQKDMKKFLPSQKYIKTLDDGSVLFEVEFTQPLEVLPFIQKWMPDMVIISPKSLKQSYIEKLQQTVTNNTRRD